MKIRLTPAQCQALYAARQAPNKKQIKKQIFAEVRRTYGLNSARLGVRNVVYADQPNYGVLYYKASKVDLDDGRPEPVVQPAPVAAAVATPVEASKTASKPVSAPAKATPAPAVKTAPKTAATASVNELVMGVNGTSKTRTPTCQIEMRFTINGERKRYGFASTEAAKQAVLKKLVG